ncbi:MAG: XrtV sorting system accessory protein [Alphaproteobacteria bacterium]
MSTPYDWGTVLIFVGIVILFFRRQQQGREEDLSRYILASIGCALANYFGNEGYHIAGLSLIGAVLFYIYFYIYTHRSVSDDG